MRRKLTTRGTWAKLAWRWQTHRSVGGPGEGGLGPGLGGGEERGRPTGSVQALGGGSGANRPAWQERCVGAKPGNVSWGLPVPEHSVASSASGAGERRSEQRCRGVSWSIGRRGGNRETEDREASRQALVNQPSLAWGGGRGPEGRQDGEGRLEGGSNLIHRFSDGGMNLKLLWDPGSWKLSCGSSGRELPTGHEDGRGARRESPPCRREAVEDSWPLASVLHLPAAPRAAEERLPVAGDL